MCEIVKEYARELYKEYIKEYAEKYAQECINEFFNTTATNLLKAGMSPDFIHSVIPDLSIHEIQKLQQNLNC